MRRALPPSGWRQKTAPGPMFMPKDGWIPRYHLDWLPDVGPAYPLLPACRPGARLPYQVTRFCPGNRAGWAETVQVAARE